MSAAASATSDPLGPWRAPLLVRHVDLVLLALALPVFLLAGLPLYAYGVGAAAWLAWRGIGAWTDARADASRDPRTVVGLKAGSMIGRGWLLALTIFLVGFLGEDAAGLSAALLLLVLFTVHFTVTIIVRSLSRA